MKQKTILPTVLCLLLLLTTHCGRSRTPAFPVLESQADAQQVEAQEANQEPESQQSSSQRPVSVVNRNEIKVRYISYLTYLGVPEEAEKALAERFEASHPDITVNVARYRRNPQSYLESDSPPDILMFPTSYELNSFAQQGMIADLREIWAEAELLDKLPPSLRSLGEWDGGLYWVPFAYTWSAIYYNNEIFSDLGLEPPTTWDEFLFICDTLLSQNITPLTMPGSSAGGSSLWFDYLNLRLNGPDFHRRLTQGQESYESVEVTDAINAWQGLIDQGYFGDGRRPSMLSQSMMQVLNPEERLPGADSAAMILVNSFMMTELTPDTRRKFEEQTSYFPFPIIDPEIPVGEVTDSIGYIVPANAENWEEAAQFLAFLSTPEVQLELKQRAGPRLTYVPSSLGNNPADLSPNIQRGVQTVIEADQLVLSIMAESPEIMGEALDSAFRRFVNNYDYGQRVQQDLEKARFEALEAEVFIQQ
ncbi:MAG: extracellular solute-binding protein [Chloroflexota bacterium]